MTLRLVYNPLIAQQTQRRQVLQGLGGKIGTGPSGIDILYSHQELAPAGFSKQVGCHRGTQIPEMHDSRRAGRKPAEAASTHSTPS